MKLTTEQLKFIKEHTDPRYIDVAVLINYLEKHRTVDKAVFDKCSKVHPAKFPLKFEERGFDDLAPYTSVERQTFIRRIPFYFYISKDGSRGGRIFRFFPDRNDKDAVEPFYETLEHLHYDLGIPVATICEYPFHQALTPKKEDGGWDFTIIDHRPYSPREMFPQWVEYLELCSLLGYRDFTPRHFLTAYNTALVAAGRDPIIYKPISRYGFTVVRDGRDFVCEGLFPCDKNNRPILKWTNLKVERPAEISFSADYSWYGELRITVTPFTKIFIKGQSDAPDENGDDVEVDPEEWVMVYAGPMNMEFDCEALKIARKEANLTQKQVAEAIGVSERTYQKWEYGNTTPDGHNLIRIMNWLSIDDVQFLTKYIEPKETNS